MISLSLSLSLCLSFTLSFSLSLSLFLSLSFALSISLYISLSSDHPRSRSPSRPQFPSRSLHAPQYHSLKEMQSKLSYSRASLRQYCPGLHYILSSSEFSSSLALRSSGSESCSSELSSSRGGYRCDTFNSASSTSASSLKDDNAVP